MEKTTAEFAKAGKRMVENIWDPVPKNLDVNTSIWCLGKEYSAGIVTTKTNGDFVDIEVKDPVNNGTTTKSKESQPRPSSDNAAPATASHDPILEAGWPPLFIDDFESRVWLTYRSGFPSIARSSEPNSSSNLSFAVRLRTAFSNQDGFTSDTGWGCMIRSGQMLLANAIALLELGRQWRRGQDVDKERRLLTAFADDPKAPFSIHRFVEHGASACGKQPGEWFGPSATAQCIQALTDAHPQANLKVYSTGHSPDVYEDAFMSVASADQSGLSPVLVLVGVRLGIDRVTPVYWDSLSALLKLPQTVGIAGGRPRASHYFVASQGQNFFYLDPHYTRPAIRFHEGGAGLNDEELESVHTRRVRRIHVRDMDPSMLLSFLIRDRDEWKSWREAVAALPGKAIIHISDNEPTTSMEGSGRKEAIDEVEAFTDDDEDAIV